MWMIRIGKGLRHERVADSCWGAMAGASLYAALSGFPPGWLLPLAATSGVLTLVVTVAGYLRMRYVGKRTFDEFMEKVRQQEQNQPPGNRWVLTRGGWKR